MESWLVAVDLVGRHTVSWSYTQRSTRDHENEGKTDSGGWILCSVYTVLSVCCTQCELMIMAWCNRERWLNFVFCDDGRETEMGDDDWNNMEDTSGCEMSGVRPTRLGLRDLAWVFIPAGLGVVPAVSGMENWLAHKILISPSFSWWFPPSPLISLFLHHHPRNRN